MKFRDIPQLISDGGYQVNVSWSYLQNWLGRERAELKLDLNPPFQRAHVWTSEQQTAYVEHVLRGGRGSNTLRFNCVGMELYNGLRWMKDFRGPFVLVDGKQRLEAVLSFLHDELPVFGGYFFHDFEDELPGMAGPDFIVMVNSLPTMEMVLKWYLEINEGGTPHTEEELSKVREMLEKEQ
jgi:hypothetical protein